MLRKIKSTKRNWIDGGKNEELCLEPWLSHNVSCTVTCKPDEWDEVAKYIYDNRQFFTGISLLPDSGELDFPQAPYCEVLTHEEISSKYGVGSMMASGLIVDGLHAFDDNLWSACDCVLGRGEDLEAEPDKKMSKRAYQALQQVQQVKKDWCRRAKQFAKRYFNGDVLEMTRCLKHVNNCKLWEDLTREYRDVDYSQLIEETDKTTLEQTVACSGGSCEEI